MAKKRSSGGTATKVAGAQIKTLAVASLKEPDYNNRTITDAALQGLSQSLADFGLIALPIVNVKSGRNVVVGGNQRVKALRDAGEETCACIVVEMDEADERTANFTLNNRAIQGEFVPQLLRDVMERIREGAGEDHEKLFKRLRFDHLSRSVMRNLAASNAPGGAQRILEGRTSDDDVPALGRTDPTSRAGRCYQLGEHLLYCGKLAEPGSLEVFDVGAADMAISRFVQPEHFKDAYLDVYIGHTLQNTEGAVYLVSSMELLAHVHGRFVALGGHWSNTLMAYEPKKAGRKEELYREVTIPVVYGWREGAKHFFYGGRDKANVFPLTAPPPKGDVPVEVAVFVMQNSSRPGDRVLDAHVIQGATVIAAEKTGRKLVGYVRSAREMDRIRHRWTRFVHGDKADWRKKTGERR